MTSTYDLRTLRVPPHVANPYALLTNNVVTDVVFMQQYTESEIAETLLKYDYEEVVDCNALGLEICIGYVKIDEVIVPPQPFPSWSLNKDLLEWFAPVPCPENTGAMIWDEETVSWVPCDCEACKSEANKTAEIVSSEVEKN